MKISHLIYIIKAQLIYLFHSKYKKNQEEEQETRTQKNKKKKQTINIIHKSMFTIVETCQFESKNKKKKKTMKLYSILYTSLFYLSNKSSPF